MTVTCSLLNPVFRETQTDWIASGTAFVDGVSVFARPDALSLDYQTAFSYGPIETGSADAGLTIKAWRVKNVTGPVTHSVVMTRENDNANGWRNDVPLFTYTGVPISEIDIAFSGDARAVVCASRLTGVPTFLSGSQVWLFWFNPASSSFAFENFGTGSTPRILLDNPDVTSLSDVLVFYVRDQLGNVYYRQQRDQYAIERQIPVPVPSSVSGSLFGSLSGTLVGRFTGSFIGVSTGFISGSLFGVLVGTSSLTNSGDLLFETIPWTSSFTGKLSGGWTGSLTGTLAGLFNNGTFNGVITGSGLFAGDMSGSFVSGTGVGECNRARTWAASGTLNGTMNGWQTGSFNGQPGLAIVTGSINGYMSGSLSGSMAGDIVGTPSGTQAAFFETYLEEVVKLRDSRVALYYSQRNTLNAEYTLKRFESVLYPVASDAESLQTSATFISGTLFNAVLTSSVIPLESLTSMSMLPTSVSLFDVVNVITSSFSNADTWTSWSLDFLSASLINIVTTASYPFNNADTWTSWSLDFMSASLINVVTIVTGSRGEDSMISCSLLIRSGSLG
jgi:hypothetical protein